MASAAVAARLQADLGGRRAEILSAEESRLLASDSEVQRHAAKLARAADARAEICELKAQLEVDDKEELRLADERSRIEAITARTASRAAEAAAERAAALERARSMATAHAEYLQAAKVHAAAPTLLTEARALLEVSIESITKAHEGCVLPTVPPREGAPRHLRLATASARVAPAVVFRTCTSRSYHMHMPVNIYSMHVHVHVACACGMWHVHVMCMCM